MPDVPKHTFGGSALDRYIYEFETPDPGGMGDPGGTAVVEPAAVEPEAIAEPAGEPSGEPAAPGAPADWDPATDPRFRQAIADEAQALFTGWQGRQPQAPVAPSAPGEPGPGYDWSALDPFDDSYGSSLGEGISQSVQSAVQEAFAPLVQAIQQSEQAQLSEKGEEMVRDIVNDAIGRGPDLTDEGKAAVRPLADLYIGDLEQRYGNTPRAWELAAEQATQYIQGVEAAAVARYSKQQENHLATLAAAESEPSVAGVASTVPGQPRRYQSPDELVRRHAPGR